VGRRIYQGGNHRNKCTLGYLANTRCAALRGYVHYHDIVPARMPLRRKRLRAAAAIFAAREGARRGGSRNAAHLCRHLRSFTSLAFAHLQRSLCRVAASLRLAKCRGCMPALRPCRLHEHLRAAGGWQAHEADRLKQRGLSMHARSYIRANAERSRAGVAPQHQAGSTTAAIPVEGDKRNASRVRLALEVKCCTMRTA